MTEFVAYVRAEGDELVTDGGERLTLSDHDRCQLTERGGLDASGALVHPVSYVCAFPGAPRFWRVHGPWWASLTRSANEPEITGYGFNGDMTYDRWFEQQREGVRS